ncbi:uncharacterized protein LOC141530716 [Cotesia typhae]|uniref:uncharacterized protein LOC141530716 n=1 Tax=Cotesia typhae TaxID=2053667 RepID=UPI003D69AA6A
MYLVLFSASKPHKEVDIVPARWLFYNNKSETCYCKFMPEPYDMSKFQQLQIMVKRCEDPLPDWPDYPVEIRGRASNFKEAQERLDVLKTEPYAYTTENEESARSESLKDKKSLEIRTKVNNAEKLREKLNSVTLNFNASGISKKSPVNRSRRNGSRNKGIDNVQNGSKLSSEDNSISDLSAYSSRHDSSEGSFNLPKKNVTSRIKRKKNLQKKIPRS